MKYQKGLKKTKDFLRTSPEPTIKEFVVKQVLRIKKLK